MPWTPDVAEAQGPIYLSIATSIIRAIEDGSLAAGEKLPSQREIARSLNVDLTTVTRALAVVQQAGRVESEGRRGSFVRHQAVGNDSDPQPDLRDEAASMNMPPEPEDNRLRVALRTGLSALLEESRPLPLHYQPSGGTDADRATAAALISRIALPTTAEETIITAGGQNALHSICRLLLDSGTAVGTGRVTYPGFLSLARHSGAHVVPLATDAEGILPEALESAARAQRLRVLYVVPTNDNPTTATMGAERRAAIAAIAERYDITIVEDDAYGQLGINGPRPVTALVPGRSWYIASTSKVLTPALRVAFVRAPSIAAAMRLAGGIHETAIMPPPLNVALVMRWLRDGSYGRMIGSVRAEANARQHIAETIFGSGRYAVAPGGYHLWMPMAEPGLGLEIANRCLAMRLPAVADSAFAAKPDDGGVRALRISLGGARTRSQLARDLRKIDALLGEPHRNHALV